MIFAHWKILTSYNEPCSAILNKQEHFPPSRRKSALFGPLCCSRSGWQLSQGGCVGDLGQSCSCGRWRHEGAAHTVPEGAHPCKEMSAFSRARCFCRSNSSILWSYNSVLGGWSYGLVPEVLQAAWVAWTIQRQDQAQCICSGWDASFSILAQPKLCAYLSDTPQPPVSA